MDSTVDILLLCEDIDFSKMRLKKIIKITKTFNNGSLGSCNDEERSEMRNVMRFAASVSHRVFITQMWHLEMIQVYLFVSEYPNYLSPIT